MSTSDDTGAPDTGGTEGDEALRREPDTGRPRLAGVTDDLPTLIAWGVLVVCVVFALVSAVAVYRNIAQLITVWVAARYQPAFRAGFNLVVLLLAATGISLAVRRLR